MALYMKLSTRYNRLTIWNRIAFWGSIASLAGLALAFHPHIAKMFSGPCVEPRVAIKRTAHPVKHGSVYGLTPWSNSIASYVISIKNQNVDHDISNVRCALILPGVITSASNSSAVGASDIQLGHQYGAQPYAVEISTNPHSTRILGADYQNDIIITASRLSEGGCIDVDVTLEFADHNPWPGILSIVYRNALPNDDRVYRYYRYINFHSNDVTNLSIDEKRLSGNYSFKTLSMPKELLVRVPGGKSIVATDYPQILANIHQYGYANLIVGFACGANTELPTYETTNFGIIWK